MNRVTSTREFVRRHVTLLSLALVGVWAVALYSYILRLPFFRDDMVMLLWLREMPWGRLWVDATGFPYYRPLSFSTLKLSELAFGWPEPISLHVLNLALHAANSTMVALLAHRFFEGNGKRIAAIAAGLLFAAYPFTYEIMPTTGPIFQLQAAFFGLGAALAYANFKSLVSNLKWLWLSLALALLGTFTCEYGVIIPAFVVAVEVMHWRQSHTGGVEPLSGHISELGPAKASTPPARFSRIPLVYCAFAAVYLAVWIVMPKSRAELPLILQGLGPALRDMPVTALYYLQGLTYPLQTLAWPLVRATRMSQETSVLIVGVLTLGGIAAGFARARRLPLLAFALAWFAIGVAPMWPTLNADYTLNGPRLHYLPSIGTTMIWGSLVAISFTHRKDTRSAKEELVSLRVACPRDLMGVAIQALGIFVVVGTLAQSVVFLHGMADVITIGGRLAADVSHTIATTTPDEPTLVVNFPSWIGKRETTYAMGAEGISLLPGYSTMREMVRLNTRQDRNVTAVTFTNTIREWKYDQRLGPPLNWNKLVKAVRAARGAWMVEYLPGTLRLSEAGSVQQVTQPEPPEVTFGDRIGLRLAGYTITGDELRVELAWTNVLTVEQQLTAFVHVYDPQGKLVAQQDGYPLLGLVPPWLAQKGEVVHDVRHIPLPARLDAGHYVVGVGVYDAETGQRVPAVSPTGGRFENDVYLMFGVDVQRSNVNSQTSNPQ